MKKMWLIALAVVGLAAVLPLLGHWARPIPPDRCRLDGLAIEPLYRVRIEDAMGNNFAFCSIPCAQLWLKRQKQPPRAIFVVDEATGREIDASTAVFVRSSVVTGSSTPNRIHVFAAREDAERHAYRARGRVLSDSERPFVNAH